MSSGYNDVIDGLVLFGLLSFPAYSAYWVRHQLRDRGRRLWIGMLAFLVWCAATYFCFLRLMFGCMGGGCADRVSPFLEFAIVYAVTSAILIVSMHLCRTKRAG